MRFAITLIPLLLAGCTITIDVKHKDAGKESSEDTNHPVPVEAAAPNPIDASLISDASVDSSIEATTGEVSSTSHVSTSSSTVVVNPSSDTSESSSTGVETSSAVIVVESSSEDHESSTQDSEDSEPNTEGPYTPHIPSCGTPPGCNGQPAEVGNCDPLSTDWWSHKSEDEAGSHHVPIGTAFTGFRAEHITPYGGWFTFPSQFTSEYPDYLIMCWSTDEFGLETNAQMYAALYDGRCMTARTFAREGVDVFPFVVMDLEPSTTYYLRGGYEVFMGIGDVSNVVKITTKPDPLANFTLPNSHPRTLVTPAQLAGLKARYEANDPRVEYWMGLSESRTNRAIDPLGDLSGPGAYATLAAMFGHITGDQKYVDGGRYLVEQVLLPEYLTLPTGNQYRWAQPHLATATDVAWDSLSTELRQQILDVIVDVDELYANSNPRFTDTDEFASTAQIQIAHGLTFLGDPELDPVSLARLQLIFERAIRWWYGGLLVKARRGDEVWGLSGGAMDDGVAYAHGTQAYWLETFWMLENAGLDQSEYAPWIWNHARNQTIYPMVPGFTGLVTYGDVETTLPDGTLQIHDNAWGVEALQICLLRQYCMDNEAGFVQDALRDSRDSTAQGGPHHWGLLCDDPAVPAKSLTDMPTAFRSNGYGLVYDRTGWGPNDSFFFFEAGWRAVDHVHDDTGHFALWSNGSFVTTEIASYDQHNADKHNVLLLSDSPRQDNLESPGLSKILKADSNSNRLYVLADLTSAYSHDFDDLLPAARVIHDEVTRTVVWNKLTDEVLVYDRVVGGQDPDETGVQNFVGSPVVTSLYNDRVGNRLEILSIVNGATYLIDTPTEFLVAGFGTFDRNSGQLVE